VHDLYLIDSPKFHIVFDFGVNIEAYHLTIRGADLGSYDGVDVVSTNFWIHDIEVDTAHFALHTSNLVLIKAGHQPR